MRNSAAQWRGGVLLTLAALIWGTAFVAQSVGMDYLGPFTFNAVRSFIGGIVLLPVIFLGRRLRKKAPGVEAPGEAAPRPKGLALLAGGLLCGLLLGTASLLQQTGIQFTTAGKAGFLTSLYIVIVPVLGIFLGRRPGAKVWAGVAVALAGAYLLSVSGDAAGGPAMGSGDLLVLVSALFFSLHILAVDWVAPRVDGVELSCVQFFVAGILSTLLALLFEHPHLQGILAAWMPLLYTGVMSSGVGYTCQILGQRNVNPTVASLILSLESVFAAVAGWLLLQQPLSPREMAGCALVLAAVVLAQLPAGKPKSQLQ